MLVNTNLLKALLKEHGHTAQDYADILKCSMTTAYGRLNGLTEHSHTELYAVRQRYGLSNERFIAIFFTPKVA